MNRPLVAITTDIITHNGTDRDMSPRTYARAVAEAGGVPVLLPIGATAPREAALRFDAFVFTGGDDPKTEPFGVPTHEKAVPIHPDRQAYETELLNCLEHEAPDVPVLGVCLGMQMMALVAGGSLNQHLPATHATADDHWEHTHEVIPAGDRDPRYPLERGEVNSKHRQAVEDPGRLRVLAKAHDDVIEVVADPGRRFYLGAQWHPERTGFAPLGAGLFRAMISVASK